MEFIHIVLILSSCIPWAACGRATQAATCLNVEKKTFFPAIRVEEVLARVGPAKKRSVQEKVKHAVGLEKSSVQEKVAQAVAQAKPDDRIIVRIGDGTVKVNPDAAFIKESLGQGFWDFNYNMFFIKASAWKRGFRKELEFSWELPPKFPYWKWSKVSFESVPSKPTLPVDEPYVTMFFYKGEVHSVQPAGDYAAAQRVWHKSLRDWLYLVAGPDGQLFQDRLPYGYAAPWPRGLPFKAMDGPLEPHVLPPSNPSCAIQELLQPSVQTLRQLYGSPAKMNNDTGIAAAVHGLSCLPGSSKWSTQSELAGEQYYTFYRWQVERTYRNYRMHDGRIDSALWWAYAWAVRSPPTLWKFMNGTEPLKIAVTSCRENPATQLKPYQLQHYEASFTWAELEMIYGAKPKLGSIQRLVEPNSFDLSGIAGQSCPVE